MLTSYSTLYYTAFVCVVSATHVPRDESQTRHVLSEHLHHCSSTKTLEKYLPCIFKAESKCPPSGHARFWKRFLIDERLYGIIKLRLWWFHIVCIKVQSICQFTRCGRGAGGQGGITTGPARGDEGSRALTFLFFPPLFFCFFIYSFIQCVLKKKKGCLVFA